MPDVGSNDKLYEGPDLVVYQGKTRVHAVFPGGETPKGSLFVHRDLQASLVMPTFRRGNV